MKDKNVVLGVTGGIAAYKAVDIVSRLMKKKAHVDVIMTKSAQKFVTPLTFESLSLNKVVSDMWAPPTSWDIEHISLAQKADVFLIAPATANIIGKIAHGIADDMLSTTVMATDAPVIIAPAMNTKMYENPITQENIEKLKQLGYIFIDPDSGRLSCGDYGKGKFPQPERIVNELEEFFNRNKDLMGKKILVTAGPTQESIDSVRFLTNHSSGKMGYAIAKAAAKRGAEVTLISGPTNLKPPQNIETVNIKTTTEMYDAVLDNFDDADVVIKAAAVSDYRPKEIYNKKIKKAGNMTIELVRNKDILLELGKRKKNQILIGFAAETDDVLKNATKKIQKKNLDFIVANDLTQKGAGFKADTNIVTIIDKDNNVKSYDKMRKDEIAFIILDKANELLT